jgi:hypothetical protein
MTIFADAFAVRLNQSNPGLAYEQVLAQVDAKVKETFPHKFVNPNRSQATVVDGGAARTAPQGAGKKGYNEMPAAAKQQCDAFVKDGVLTRDQYVKDFFELEA